LKKSNHKGNLENRPTYDWLFSIVGSTVDSLKTFLLCAHVFGVHTADLPQLKHHQRFPRLEELGVAVGAFPLALDSADHTSSRIAFRADVADNDFFEAVVAEKQKFWQR